jgi:outer membrane protein OmpA-like peptidoglycan-associated protein
MATTTVKTTTKAMGAGLAVALLLGGCAQVRETVRRGVDRNSVVTAPSCQDFTFPIYFETGSDQPTPAALQVMDDNAARVRACSVAQVTVTGLADAQGSAAENMDLSRRRAAAVAQALSQRGYPTPTFQVAAAGDVGATGPRGAASPMRRVAQVSVRFETAAPR